MAEITGQGAEQTRAKPPASERTGRWLIGCVADNNWRFLDQSLALVRSLRWFGGAAAESDFIVCVVDSAKPAYIREMSRYRAEVRVVPTYNREYPVTNKLRFLQQSDLSRYDHILLLDCDTLVVQNPLTSLTGERLQAKMVPRRGIPHELFEKIFRLFDVPLPGRNYEYSVSKELSIPYFNTGVVCLHKAQLTNLVPAWIEFVNRLIERIELIAEREWFIEQVALSLALAATGSQFGVLGNEMNFQIHVFPGEVYEPRLEGIDPRIIHYHRGVTARDEIARSPYPLVSARIDMFNERVREERAPATSALSPLKAKAFEAFGKPDGPLGIWLAGHRDYVGGRWLEVSRLQTDFMIKMGLRPEHVLLDVGCGSLRGGVEFISYLHAGNYLGLDSSNRLIQKGIKEELGRRLLKLKSPEFVVSRHFEFEKFSEKPDFAIAHSIFTHLTESDIRLCLEKLRRFVNPGCRLYATYFIADTLQSNQSNRSHSQKSFRYSRAMVEDFGAKAGWTPTYIGEWSHPENQMMVEYIAY
jgi:ubiquinone/menaquinone biosynthesis C-methylase UbiE